MPLFFNLKKRFYTRNFSSCFIKPSSTTISYKAFSFTLWPTMTAVPQLFISFTLIKRFSYREFLLQVIFIQCWCAASIIKDKIKIHKGH